MRGGIPGREGVERGRIAGRSPRSCDQPNDKPAQARPIARSVHDQLGPSTPSQVASLSGIQQVAQAGDQRPAGTIRSARRSEAHADGRGADRESADQRQQLREVRARDDLTDAVGARVGRPRP